MLLISYTDLLIIINIQSDEVIYNMMKLFISQAMSNRKENEVRAERWFYHVLAQLRYGNTNNEIELINQYDCPPDMPIFEGTAANIKKQQSLWLLGRSIQMMKDADIIIIVGNPIESKGMMVEYEVIRQYKDKGKTWWVHTGKDMVDWCIKSYPHEYLDAKQTYNKYLSGVTYGAEGPDVPKNWMETNVKENNIDKPLIDEKELYCIIHEYLESELEKYENLGYWRCGSYDGLFCWILSSDSSCSTACIGFRIVKENDTVIGYKVWNTYSTDAAFFNIDISKDGIKFIEDSEFKDFDRDFMYHLYEIIRDKIEGENK